MTQPSVSGRWTEFTRAHTVAVHVAFLSAVSLLAFGGYRVFVSDDVLLPSFRAGDAFFYFTIARNITHGGMVSFDGIHLTNGFHPLWLAAILPVFGLVSDDVLALRCIVGIEIVFATFGLFFLYFALRDRPLGRAFALVFPVLIAAHPSAGLAWTSEMESPLLLFLLGVAFWQISRIETTAPSRAGPYVRLGGTLALIFLTRLESIVFVVAAIIALPKPLRARRRLCVFLLLPPAITCAAYLIANHIVFDLWVPVSGSTKVAWFRHLGLRDQLDALLDIPWLGQLLVGRAAGVNVWSDAPLWGKVLHGGAVAATAWFLWRQRAALRPWTDSAPAKMIAVGALLQIGVGKLLIGTVWDWQRGPYLLIAPWIVTGLLHKKRQWTAWVLGAALLLCARTSVRQFQTLPHPPNMVAQARVGRWLGTLVPASDLIGGFGIGAIAYFAHRHMMCLDGLTQDAEFYRTVSLTGQLEPYLTDHDVRWIADFACPPYEHRALKYYPGSEHDVPLMRDFRVVNVSEPLNPDGCTSLVLWKRRGP